METATPANGRVERAQGVQFYSIQMSGQKTRQIVQSAENNQGSQILLDTNRRIYSIQINGIMLIAARFSRDHALAPGFELVAPAFIFVPRKLTAPRSSNRNNTSFKNVRNPLSPNKKAFSNTIMYLTKVRSHGRVSLWLLALGFRRSRNRAKGTFQVLADRSE